MIVTSGQGMDPLQARRAEDFGSRADVLGLMGMRDLVS